MLFVSSSAQLRLEHRILLVTNNSEKKVQSFLTVLWNCAKFAHITVKKSPQDVTLQQEDKWILSRLSSLQEQVTSGLETHTYHHSFFAIKQFVENDFSKWYIRLIRERQEENDPSVAFTFKKIFHVLLRLLAPFAPYLSEYLWQTLRLSEQSVHLESWPTAEERDISLENAMMIAKETTELLLALRETKKLNVRRPIAAATIEVCEQARADSLNDVKQHIMKEANVKQISVVVKEDKIEKLDVTVDETLTTELEQEWLQREFVRRVQQFRKNNNMKKEDMLGLMVFLSASLQEKMGSISEALKQKMGLTQLVFSTATSEDKGTTMHMPYDEKIVFLEQA